MSDLSIPGVTSKYDTQKLVEDLMKVERIPKTRAEGELKALEKRSTVWQDLNTKMARMRDSSRTLFSFRNPFTERVGASSDEAVLSATATRDAIIESRSIQVKRTATADRFLSEPQSPDFKVGAGTYTFGVGDKSVSFKYSGGSLSDFADALNRRGKDILRAQVISVEKGKNSLLVESLATGSSKRLSFSDEAQALALKTGMMERASSSERKAALEPAAIKPAAGKALDPAAVAAAGGVLTVKAGGSASIPFSSPVQAQGSNMVLEFEYRTIVRSTNQSVAAPPPGPSLPDPGAIEFQGIRIESDPLAAPLPPWKAPPEPVRVDDLDMVKAGVSGGKEISLGGQSDSSSFAKASYPLSSLPGALESLVVRNANTNRDIEIRSVRVYDPTETGGLRPKSPVSTARDAVVVMDGIEVTRESNSIDDLIPGVTMNLHEASDKPVKLSIEPDRKAAKDAIIAWIGNYNQLMTELNILMKADDKVVSELSYLSVDEKKAATERLGLLQGDFTLSQIKNSLQRISMNPYATSAGQQMTLLAQMGISTNAQSTGSAGYDQSRLRGYLEVDEAKLDEALRSRLPAVKELYGNDSDGDLLIDSGVAFSVDALMKPYVETGGIVAQKRQGISGQIDRQKRTIATMEEQLVRKEQDLKTKYGMMEGALNTMERTSNSLDNFSKNGNN